MRGKRKEEIKKKLVMFFAGTLRWKSCVYQYKLRASWYIQMIVICLDALFHLFPIGFLMCCLICSLLEVAVEHTQLKAMCVGGLEKPRSIVDPMFLLSRKWWVRNLLFLRKKLELVSNGSSSTTTIAASGATITITTTSFPIDACLTVFLFFLSARETRHGGSSFTYGWKTTLLSVWTYHEKKAYFRTGKVVERVFNKTRADGGRDREKDKKNYLCADVLYPTTILPRFSTIFSSTYFLAFGNGCSNNKIS